MKRRNSTRTIRIPIKIRDGRITYFYGGALPEILEGEVGELIVPESAISDSAVRARLNDEKLKQFVASGTELRVRVSRTSIPESLARHVLETPLYALAPVPAVAFRLTGGSDHPMARR